MSDWGDHNVPHTASSWDGGVAMKRRSRGRWYVLFLLSIAGIVLLPLFDMVELSLAGIPFVYWYTVGWIAAVVISWMAYAKEKRRQPEPR